MDLYSGFWIEDRVGNNSFSYDERDQKRIYVPPLEKAGIDELRVSNMPCFCEVLDGTEICCNGLEKFIETKTGEIPVYVFDNHNHAFYFWVDALHKGAFETGVRLVHIDQHKDMREPKEYIGSIDDRKSVFEYVNYVLNVGNFIKPALKLGMFSDVIIIDSEYGFREQLCDIDGDFVLDIDVDIFSKDMDYIDFDLRMDGIKGLVEKAKTVTVATSPYFIDQSYAIEIVKKIME